MCKAYWNRAKQISYLGGDCRAKWPSRTHLLTRGPTQRAWRLCGQLVARRISIPCSAPAEVRLLPERTIRGQILADLIHGIDEVRTACYSGKSNLGVVSNEAFSRLLSCIAVMQRGAVLVQRTLAIRGSNSRRPSIGVCIRGTICGGGSNSPCGIESQTDAPSHRTRLGRPLGSANKSLLCPREWAGR